MTFVRTETPAKNRQQFWVTLCQEGDIRERILRLGVEQEDLCEVTTTANALIAAYRASLPLSSRAILVHLGAQTTMVALSCWPARAPSPRSFQMGGDFFTRALARLRQLLGRKRRVAEAGRNLLRRTGASPEFADGRERLGGGTQAAVERMVRAQSRPCAPEAASFESGRLRRRLRPTGLARLLKSRGWD